MVSSALFIPKFSKNSYIYVYGSRTELIRHYKQLENNPFKFPSDTSLLLSKALFGSKAHTSKIGCMNRNKVCKHELLVLSFLLNKASIIYEVYFPHNSVIQ